MDDLIPLPSPGRPLVFGDAGRPAVVLVHDRFGRLPWLEPYAEAMAQRAAFRVLIPDLYSGVATTDEAESGRLLSELAPAEAENAVEDAVRTARDEGASRVGLVGFGLGGRLALRVAQTGAADAVVAYYATLADEEHTLIPCPVLLNLAEVDEWAPGADPESFVDRLHDHGTPVAQHRYTGTGRFFANANLLDRVEPNAAALAFARSTVFLEQNIDG